MIIDAYKHYRLLATKSISNSGYLCFNEFELYESIDMDSVNLCLGAIPTASSESNATTFKKSNAIDGDQTTAWESVTPHGLGHWFAVELPEPKIIRAIKTSSAKYPNEAPGDFIIQGSHDGLNWVDLYKETGNTESEITRLISLHISGVSKLDTGERVIRILVHNWSSGQLMGIITPNTDGSWFFTTKTRGDVLVTHLGPVGFEPKSDGPITPYSW